MTSPCGHARWLRGCWHVASSLGTAKLQPMMYCWCGKVLPGAPKPAKPKRKRGEREKREGAA